MTGEDLARLVDVFNATPPLTSTISKVDYADVWTKPRADTALVVFYKRRCFVALMRMMTDRLRNMLGRRT